MSTPIPPGVDLKDDQRPQLIKYVVACCVLSGFALAGRLASRKIQKSNFMASDYLVAAGLLGSWVISGITIDAAMLGLGKHIEVVPLRHVELILRNVTVLSIVYAITQTLIKISILVFYHEIFLGKGFVLLTYIIGAFVLTWFLGTEIVIFVSCRPLEGNWDITLDPSAKCINLKAAYIWLSFPNIITDVALLCLPLGKVWQLQMSLRSKVAVAGMFLLGGFVTIVSIIRFIVIFSMEKADITWSSYDNFVWCCVEINIAVVSACLPILRPLVRKIYPATFVRRVFGSQRSKGAIVDSRTSSQALDRSSRLEDGEELQRLPDNPSEAMPGWHITETHSARVPKSKVDEFELRGVTKPHDGIAVHKSFSTY